jgi:hypothetical protein
MTWRATITAKCTAMPRHNAVRRPAEMWERHRASWLRMHAGGARGDSSRPSVFLPTLRGEATILAEAQHVNRLEEANPKAAQPAQFTSVARLS